MKTIRVVGSPRCGSSMASGIFSRLGVSMADSSINKPENFNPTGYYEHGDFNKFCRKITTDFAKLRDKHYSDNNYLIKDLPEYERYDKDLQMKVVFELLKKYKPEADKLIEKHSKPIWGFKALDNVSLRVTVPLFPNTHILVVTRNPFKNALSFACLSHKPDSFHLITRELERLANSLNYLQKSPIMYTTYDLLKYNTVAEAKKMAGFIGLKPTEDQLKDIDKFIDPNQSTWGNG